MQLPSWAKSTATCAGVTRIQQGGRPCMRRPARTWKHDRIPPLPPSPAPAPDSRGDPWTDLFLAEPPTRSTESRRPPRARRMLCKRLLLPAGAEPGRSSAGDESHVEGSWPIEPPAPPHGRTHAQRLVPVTYARAHGDTPMCARFVCINCRAPPWPCSPGNFPRLQFPIFFKKIRSSPHQFALSFDRCEREKGNVLLPPHPRARPRASIPTQPPPALSFGLAINTLAGRTQGSSLPLPAIHFEHTPSRVQIHSLPQRQRGKLPCWWYKEEASNGSCPCPLLPPLLALLLPRPAGRGRRVRRVAERPRHLLRRRRRLRHNGRRVRVRQPVQPGVRHQHGGAQHGALQRRQGLRLLLRAALRQRRRLLPPRLHHGHRHQLLPAQLRPPQRRRRLVQPAAAPLRHGTARLPPHRAVPRRHRPRRIQEGAVREEGRHPVHHQRPLLLQPGAGHQRGRRRRRAVRRHQGRAHRLAAHVPQLGPELAEQRLPRRPVPLLPGHLQRRPHTHQQRRRTRRVAVRADIRGRTVLALCFCFFFFLSAIIGDSTEELIILQSAFAWRRTKEKPGLFVIIVKNEVPGLC